MTETTQPLSGQASLQGILADVLREAPLGLTPASLLEVVQERGLIQEEGLTERGAYQRVLRALQQLEGVGVVSRTGRRYVLDLKVVDGLLECQAMDLVVNALQGSALTADPLRLRSWVDRCIEKLVVDGFETKDPAIRNQKPKNSK